MKVTFITTFYNEEKHLSVFLTSLANQTVLPDEIIMVDGGSTDKSLAVTEDFTFPIPREKIKVITKKGNRSLGRNEAIRKASNAIILCSDVGCVLDKNWVKEIVKPFEQKSTDVVAGYYKARASTVFQKSLVPFAFVMPDKVNPETFLPATRSVAFKKSVWEKVGGFNEEYSHNEDYVFARKIKKAGFRITFAESAIVEWIPRTTVKEAYHMMWRFALGDAEAGIYRPKVIFLFVRYIFAIVLVFIAIVSRSSVLLLISGIFLLLYILWAISKNYRYVREVQAFFYLPLLQFVADAAVIDGSLRGLIHRWKK